MLTLLHVSVSICIHTYMHRCSLANLFQYSILHPLWDLSVCCTYHISGFILFIRFHIWVRSYGICLSLIGLFCLAIIISRSFQCCCKGWECFLFYSCKKFHSANAPELFYPLIYWWALGLFLDIGYCKLHCYEHRGAYILSD